MSVEQNKLAFRSIPERIYNTKDLSLIDEYFSEDYVERAPVPPGFPEGRAAVHAWFTELFNAFPDLQTTVTHVVGEGDDVAGRISCRGTNLGSFMGMPASGNVVEWSESHFGRMSNGKLAEHWANWDQFEFMQQIGVIPQMDAQPEQAGTNA